MVAERRAVLHMGTATNRRWRTQPGLWRQIALLATILSGAAILVSGTRSAMIAAGVGLLFLVFSRGIRPGRRHLITALAIAGALVIFYESPGGIGLRARVQWSADETIGGARPLLWRDSLRMASAHLLTGLRSRDVFVVIPAISVGRSGSSGAAVLSRIAAQYRAGRAHERGISGSVDSAGVDCGGSLCDPAREKRIAASRGVERSAGGIGDGFIVQCFNHRSGNHYPDGYCNARGASIKRRRLAEADVPRIAPAAIPDSSCRVHPRSRRALAAFGVFLTVSDFHLAEFSRMKTGAHGELAVAAYNSMRKSELDGPSEDLYCSRRLADSCGTGFLEIARFECSRVATQAAARATVTADNPPNAFYNLAMFAAALNDARGTEKELRQAASLAPNWFQPHWALANLLARAGRHSDAVAEIQRALFLTGGKNQEVAETPYRPGLKIPNDRGCHRKFTTRKQLGLQVQTILGAYMNGRTSFLAGVLILAGVSQGLMAQPSISAGGVVSNATYQAGQGLATGTLVSIFGTQMASTVAFADSIPLATQLANTSVSFNGVAAPLLYVSSGQINAQLPYEVLPPGTSGTVNVTVTSNGQTSTAQSVVVGQFSPGIFMINQYATAVITTDPSSPRYGAFAAPVGAIPGVATFPAVTNDVLTIYAAGLGAVTPSIPSGHTSTDALRNDHHDSDCSAERQHSG